MKRPLSLSNSLVAGVTLISTVFLSLLVWNSVRILSQSNAYIIERTTKEKSLLISELLVPGLLSNDRAMLADVFSQLKKHDSPLSSTTTAPVAATNTPQTSTLTVPFADLMYAYVYNRQGKLMASLNDHTFSKNSFKADQSYTDAAGDGIFDVRQVIMLHGHDGHAKPQWLGDLYLGFSIKSAQNLVHKTRWQNALIATGLLVVTITLTFLLCCLITRHLRRLEQGTHALRRGEFGHRIPLYRSDDYGGLVVAFNNLAGHLQHTQTELDSQQQALQREKRHLETMLNGINAVVWEINPHTLQFTYVSRESETLLKFPQADWLTDGFFARHLHPENIDWVLRDLRNTAHILGSRQRDFRMINANGDLVWVRDISNAELDETGQLRLRGLFLDVSAEVASEERILYLANHDSLTGLINRRQFQEELQQQLDYSKRYNTPGALLFLDLDQFKYVNDWYGHQIGDEFLIEISKRLCKALRKTDIIGRLGGDEFGIILPRGDRIQAKKAAANLLRVLTEQDVVFNEHPVAVGASIGITIFPEQGSTLLELLANADTAMYTAKDQGRTQFHIYESCDKNVTLMSQLARWDEQIRVAFEQDRFVLHFQPILDLSKGKTIAYECLLRMLDDNGVLVPPGDFLGKIDRFGLITKIDQWVIHRTIEFIAQNLAPAPATKISINLSRWHFGNNAILVFIQQTLNTYGVRGEALIIEISAQAIARNYSQSHALISGLKDLGCRFAIDQYGDEYSSLYCLKKLPIDYVKLDSRLIRKLQIDPENRLFIKSIVEIAHGMRIKVIAEGIENINTLELMQQLKADYGQGFLLGTPDANLTPGKLPKAAKLPVI